MGLFNKIKKLNIFSGLFSVDEDFFEELEESLILSDMGDGDHPGGGGDPAGAGKGAEDQRAGGGKSLPAGDFWWKCWRWESPAWTCPASRR